MSLRTLIPQDVDWDSVLDVDVTGNNVNLRTLADGAGYNGTDRSLITFTVRSGVGIGTVSYGTPSMVTGAFAAGSQIVLVIDGWVEGYGGAGGQGGIGNANNGSPGQAGDAAGAISMNFELRIENNGQIWGGGGGGGGGGSYINPQGGAPGGGGGAGLNAGAAGAEGCLAGPGFCGNTPAAAGTISSGGNGGTNAGNQGNGGNGGGPGLAGAPGAKAASTSPGFGEGGAGGNAGVSIDKNGFTLIWLTVGDVRGPQT